jgi:hypothetical protein
MISPSREAQIGQLRAAVARLARVDECLCLGVFE